ncbi:MAG: hypothetical protein HRK26_01940 [Rickettsiaceae bacterium H1]|nr:hypothetical protein [Rickettsiaceae bacterium H1]
MANQNNSSQEKHPIAKATLWISGLFIVAGIISAASLPPTTIAFAMAAIISIIPIGKAAKIIYENYHQNKEDTTK